MEPGHPRHELDQDADALERVALIADYLAGLARDDDPVNADRVEGEAQILRNWATLCRTAKDDTPVQGEHGRG